MRLALGFALLLAACGGDDETIKVTQAPREQDAAPDAAAIRKAAEQRAAKEKAETDAAAATEKAYQDAVDARAATVALRKHVDARRRELVDRIQTAKGQRKDLFRAVADYCNKHVYSGDNMLPIDTAIERAKTLFAGKRYADATTSFLDARARMEKIAGLIEQAEWRVAAAAARKEVFAASKKAREAYSGLPTPAIVKDAAAAAKSGDERRKADDHKGADADFRRARDLYKEAIDVTPVLRAAYDEATRTARKAMLARKAWTAFAKREGIDAAGPAATADAVAKGAGALAKSGDFSAAAKAFRKAAKMYAALKSGQNADAEAAMKKAQQGKPPDPPGDYPTALHRHAVGLALQWLQKHQDDKGFWDSDGFMQQDPKDDRCDGKGKPLRDTGLTGLALTCFLRAGFTDRAEGPKAYYNLTVHRGLSWLRASQDNDDGVFGTRMSNDFMYGHCMATLAMCEAARLTGDKRYKKSAQMGINFLARARNPGLAWRYEPRGKENDTSVTAWAIRAMDAGRRAELSVDPDAFPDALEWIDKMTDPEFGQVGYNYPGGSPARPEGLGERFPAERSQAMTAAGLLVRLICGQRSGSVMRKGLDLLAETPPVWNPENGAIDMYYWHLALRVLKHENFGKRARDRVVRTAWEKRVRSEILLQQHQDGARAGSWDPIGVWGLEGGRIYSTAILALALVD